MAEVGASTVTLFIKKKCKEKTYRSVRTEAVPGKCSVSCFSVADFCCIAFKSRETGLDERT